MPDLFLIVFITQAKQSTLERINGKFQVFRSYFPYILERNAFNVAIIDKQDVHIEVLVNLENFATVPVKVHLVYGRTWIINNRHKHHASTVLFVPIFSRQVLIDLSEPVLGVLVFERAG